MRGRRMQAAHRSGGGGGLVGSAVRQRRRTPERVAGSRWPGKDVVAAEEFRNTDLACLLADDTRPARGDFGERLDEAVGVATTVEVRVIFAEGGEVGIESGAVMGLEGVEPVLECKCI